MAIQYIDRKSGELLTENPPAEGLLKFLYTHPFGKTAFLPLVKRKFISDWYGKRMDKPSSKKRIQSFVNEFDIDLNEAEKSINEFTSFNDFFYRKLKPAARKIEDGFISPGDGRLLAFENVADVNEFYVKGRKFTMNEFLSDAALAQKYQNASMFILRLAPNDYHRYHFPCNGIPSEMRKIKGRYFSVSPYALAQNFTQVFCENKREICTLQTKDKGDMLIIPVGATMVGSMVSTFNPNQKITKGDEMGYFAFGGSTIVVLIDKNYIKINQDLLKNTQNKLETYVQMGEKIAD